MAVKEEQDTSAGLGAGAVVPDVIDIKKEKVESPNESF